MENSGDGGSILDEGIAGEIALRDTVNLFKEQHKAL